MNPVAPLPILVADDDRLSRMMMEKILSKWGYQPVLADNGEAAWNILRKPDGPRLAVLDWVMPGLDGVEICRRLKQGQSDRFVYTLILTGKKDLDSVVLALDAGAHDYLTKPCDAAELHSRIKVGLHFLDYESRLAEKNAELARYAGEMAQLAENRARQLVHADRMATLGVLSAGVAHEINNPVSFISGNAQSLDVFLRDLREILERATVKDEDRRKVAFILQETPEVIAGIRGGVSRISKIVSGLKSYCHKQKQDVRDCRVNDCVAQALELCHNALKYKVTVVKKLQDDLPVIKADGQQLEQVLVNLLMNARDAMERQEEGRITITTRTGAGGGVEMELRDSGPGIPKEILDRVWDPFFTTKEPGKGTGLGLSIVQGIVRDHGGEIEVRNLPEGGAAFAIRLPLHPPLTEKKHG